MLELLKQSWAGSAAPLAAGDVFVRLLLAALFGLAVAALYRRARREAHGVSSFPATLVLLAVLIAMVTQVIGDNVARAFSLVGALSIVRFRTVVRDTKDTAYVILAVIVGMAVGSSNLAVAALGIGVVGIVEVLFGLAGRWSKPAAAEYALKVKGAAGQDLDGRVGEAIGGMLERRELLSLGVSKQGEGAEKAEASYRVQLREGVSLADLLQRLAATSGIVGVQVVSKGGEED